ncbi:MAG: sodium:solute symporter family protein, partial [Halalkalicoccus sp.]|nr:sodium:solute symporter family protein [Halalkalicoccus sp.]
KDAEDLKSTFRLQAPIFFFAAITLWIIGMFASGVFPRLSESGSEQVVPYLLGAFVQIEGGTLLPSLIALGVIMATLSTAGATVMVVSMVLAKDLYGRFIDPEAPDGRIINASRVFLALSLLVALGIAFQPSLTIWAWTELKFEFLLQATPLFVFGLYTHRVKNTPAIAGMLVGCAVAIALYLTGNSEVFSFHAGIVGLVVNSVVLLGGSYLSGQDEETERAKRILRYNSIAVADADDETAVRYVLPAQTKSFWIGLGIIIAVMVPWYAPDAWNARLAFGLPIWTWVTIGALVLETLFVVFSTYIWRPKPPRDSEQDVPREEETPAD